MSKCSHLMQLTPNRAEVARSHSDSYLELLVGSGRTEMFHRLCFA